MQELVFNISSKYFLANILKLLANRVFVLIANVVKEGNWRLKLLVNPMGLRTLKSKRLDSFPFFVNFSPKIGEGEMQ